MTRPIRAVTKCLIGAWLAFFVVLLVFTGVSDAAEPKRVRAATVSPMLRFHIQRAADAYFWNENAPARLAAQIHQESSWNPRAQSPYAQGLTQFTPATAKWLPSICPEVGAPDVWDTRWSIDAMACYDAWLAKRVVSYDKFPKVSSCTRWAFALRGYNGGERMLSRERAKTLAAGANPNDWRAVEKYRVRAGWAHKENIEYPQRILIRIEQAYIDAGWPGERVCT
jgi:membrane-bound lytic murein transglycosylase MltF